MHPLASRLSSESSWLRYGTDRELAVAREGKAVSVWGSRVVCAVGTSLRRTVRGTSRVTLILQVTLICL